MTAAELLIEDPMLRGCWTVHEALQRLGFKSDDIFVLMAENIAVQLRVDGKSFAVNLGVYPDGSEMFGQRWTIIVEGIRTHSVSDQLLEDSWAQSKFQDDDLSLGFIETIKSKGIEMPERNDAN